MLIAVDHVEIRTNPQTRESRLFPSTWGYVRKNMLAIVRVYTMYEPLRVFLAGAAVCALIGAVIWVRFLYYFTTGHGHGHVQSVILGGTMLVISVQLAGLAVLADVLAAIRLFLQRALGANQASGAAARRRALSLRAGRRTGRRRCRRERRIQTGDANPADRRRHALW